MPNEPIRAWRVHPLREPASGRRYTAFAISTDSDLIGWGEAPYFADAVERFEHHCAPLVGQDALAAQAVSIVLADAPPEVRAAVDTALLDLAGKVAGAPIYQLLSGRTRDKARAVAVLDEGDETAVDRALERALAAGFEAFSVPLSIPKGPTRGRAFFDRTQQHLERLRHAGAKDLVLDCRGRASAAEAAGLAARLETFHLLWLDEPTARINRKSLDKISAESVTPIGWGRNITDNAAYQDLLRAGSIDVLRPDPARVGISSARKAAALAESYYVAVAPYSRGGPIAAAAALQIAASTPNFFALDVPFSTDPRDRAMREALAGGGLERPAGGFLELPTKPGLGIDINEDALREYAA